MRRAALAAAFGLVLGGVLLLAPRRAAADDPCGGNAPCVVVHIIDGTQQIATHIVTVGDITRASDVTGAHYQTRNKQNAVTDEPYVGQGLSIRGLLQLPEVGIVPAAVSYTETVGRTQHIAKLNAATDDFADPSDPSFPFQNSLEPVFWSSDGGASIEYFRPLRDDTDQNYQDYLQSDDHGYLTLAVHESGTILSPAITAQPTTIKAGQSVNFHAAVDDPDNQEALTYTWYFYDGTSTETQDPNVQHTYSTAGTYYPYVDVAGSNGSSGESTGVLIKVDPTPAQHHHHHHHHPQKPPPSGPSNGNGGSLNPTSGPISGSGHHGGGAPSAPSTSTAGTPQTGPATSNEAGPPASSGPPAGAIASNSSSSAARSRSATTVPVPGGIQIAGYLVAPAPAGAGARPSTSAPPPVVTAPAARNGRIDPAFVGWLFGGLAVIALLAFGAHAEARQAPRPANRQHR